jgi:hypothetical protein
MQENIGDIERWLRVAAGGALIFGGARALSARGAALAPALMLASGALVLETALTRVCPLNALLGVDTRKSRSTPEQLSEAGGTSGDSMMERAVKDIGAAQRPPADS